MADAVKASAALIEATASGVLTAVEAGELAKLDDVFVGAIETGEIEERGEARERDGMGWHRSLWGGLTAKRLEHDTDLLFG